MNELINADLDLILAYYDGADFNVWPIINRMVGESQWLLLARL